MPAGFAVNACDDAELWRRVERAAAGDGVSVAEFAWAALAGWVDAAEEVMLVDPRTDRAFGSRLSIDRCRRMHIRAREQR